LLEVIYYGSSTTNCFPAFDGNGNITALVNAADGTSVASYEYGPFGEVIRATGPMAKANPFRFSTKYQDDENDLVYYGHRYYNPSTGRWIGRDPVAESGFYLLNGGLQMFLRKATTAKELAQVNKMLAELGGFNLYNFVGNDPQSGVDILGLLCLYDSVTCGILDCIEAGNDPAACLCITSPDEKECKKKLGDCIKAGIKCIPNPETGKPPKPSLKDVCKCACEAKFLDDDKGRDACKKMCDKLKK